MTLRKRRASHLLGRVPVCVVSEWKDMRRVRVLAGPDYGVERWVHVSQLKPVHGGQSETGGGSAELR